MADTVEITFTNVQLQDSNGNIGAFSTTTLDVDYATGVVTVVAGGPLTFTSTADGTSTFGTLSVTPTTPPGGPYTLQTEVGASPSLSFLYSGEQPTEFTSGSLVTASSNITFSEFTNNSLFSVCFARGTLIRTPHGDVAIETLKAGDLVVTSSGASRPVKWVGHQAVVCGRRKPIRIAADAIAPNVPSRDLVVSPAHSICLDLFGETLVLAESIVNGATIAPLDVPSVEYWHVELDSHDLVIANNLPAESYLAMGNRAFFQDAALRPDQAREGAELTHDDFCRPVMKDEADLAFVKRRLLKRAEAIGWTRTSEAGLRLAVDGEILLPRKAEDGLHFDLPAGARDVRILSDVFVPARMGGSDDRRALGVAVFGLAVIGDGARREISLDDPRLVGFHPDEARDGECWRWTRGELALSPDLFEGMSGAGLRLRVGFESVHRGWRAPAPADRAAPRLAIAS